MKCLVLGIQALHDLPFFVFDILKNGLRVFHKSEVDEASKERLEFGNLR